MNRNPRSPSAVLNRPAPPWHSVQLAAEAIDSVRSFAQGHAHEWLAPLTAALKARPGNDGQAPSAAASMTTAPSRSRDNDVHAPGPHTLMLPRGMISSDIGLE